MQALPMAPQESVLTADEQKRKLCWELAMVLKAESIVYGFLVCTVPISLRPLVTRHMLTIARRIRSASRSRMSGKRLWRSLYAPAKPRSCDRGSGRQCGRLTTGGSKHLRGRMPTA